MKKIYVILAVLFMIIEVVLIFLTAFHIVPAYFCSTTMKVFQTISIVSIYTFAGLCFLVSVLSLLKIRLQRVRTVIDWILDKIPLIVLILLTLTIISVDVIIIVWGMALFAALMFLLLTIPDLR